MNELGWKRVLTADLHWVLTCPPLLAPDKTLWQPAVRDFDLTKTVASHWQRLLQARSGKLGGYFEALVSALFSASDHWDVLAENLIIQNGKQTLGELDLLVQRRATAEVIHLELALKFYLWAAPAAATSLGWVGAGLQDFMLHKTQRLHRHQLQLARLAEDARQWPARLPFPDRTALWMPGRLYLPNSSSPLARVRFGDTPWSLNPLAEKSYWRLHTPLDTPLPALAKADWLCGRATTTMAIAALPAQVLGAEQAPIYLVSASWQRLARQAISRQIPASDSPD